MTASRQERLDIQHAHASIDEHRFFVVLAFTSRAEASLRFTCSDLTPADLPKHRCDAFHRLAVQYAIAGKNSVMILKISYIVPDRISEKVRQYASGFLQDHPGAIDRRLGLGHRAGFVLLGQRPATFAWWLMWSLPSQASFQPLGSRMP